VRETPSGSLAVLFGGRGTWGVGRGTWGDCRDYLGCDTSVWGEACVVFIVKTF
jgi:hypothetical protein